MSTESLTYWATFVAGVSMLLIVLLDRRKPARRERIRPRRLGRGGVERPVVHAPAMGYIRTPWWRRILAVGGLAVTTGILGVFLAIAVGGIAIALLWYLSNAVS